MQVLIFNQVWNIINSVMYMKLQQSVLKHVYKMEEKYNKWQEKFDDIREKRLTLIDDMLIDLDLYIDKRD